MSTHFDEIPEWMKDDDRMSDLVNVEFIKANVIGCTKPEEARRTAPGRDSGAHDYDKPPLLTQGLLSSYEWAPSTNFHIKMHGIDDLGITWRSLAELKKRAKL